MVWVNVVGALIIGTLAAAVMGWVLVRRLLKKSGTANLSRARKWVVRAVAILVFPIALLIGYMAAIAVINAVAKPGPALHVTFDVIVALSIGTAGALLTWLAALASSSLLSMPKRTDTQ